jgi:short-subunit dehydrogenase
MGQADIDEGIRINCILPGLVSSPLWHDREDKMIDWGKLDGRKYLLPDDIAEVMLKMVESKEYEGGTCVVKTPYEERIEEEGHTKALKKLKE